MEIDFWGTGGCIGVEVYSSQKKVAKEFKNSRIQVVTSSRVAPKVRAKLSRGGSCWKLSTEGASEALLTKQNNDIRGNCGRLHMFPAV